MKEFVLNLIKAYEKKMSGMDVDYTITEAVPANEATLYLFEGAGIKAAAVAYSDGSVFVMSDWQEPTRPTTPAEVPDYSWCSIDGSDAIILNGLPRNL